MVLASMDTHYKKHLVVKPVIHKLLTLALTSCETLLDDKKFYAVDATKVLYNLASFDRVRYYIPGETASVSQRRKKFATWGGLVGLYYLNQHSTLTEVKDFFENSSMKDVQVADLVLLRDTVKKLVNGKEEIQKSEEQNVQSSTSLKENEVQQPESDKQGKIVLEKNYQEQNVIYRNKDFSE
jgi:hypothetical protein